MKRLFDQMEQELPPVARAKRSTKLHTLQRALDHLRNLKIALATSCHDIAILRMSTEHQGVSNTMTSTRTHVSSWAIPPSTSPQLVSSPQNVIEMLTPIATPPIPSRPNSTTTSLNSLKGVSSLKSNLHDTTTSPSLIEQDRWLKSCISSNSLSMLNPSSTQTSSGLETNSVFSDLAALFSPTGMDGYTMANLPNFDFLTNCPPQPSGVLSSETSL
jgi:hypothetical protein